MFPNSSIRQDLSHARQVELDAQLRHSELLRRARSGQLQPEIREGRRHQRRTRLAALLHGKPAAV
jgi:hypothetical protein